MCASHTPGMRSSLSCRVASASIPSRPGGKCVAYKRQRTEKEKAYSRASSYKSYHRHKNGSSRAASAGDQTGIPPPPSLSHAHRAFYLFSRALALSPSLPCTRARSRSLSLSTLSLSLPPSRSLALSRALSCSLTLSRALSRTLAASMMPVMMREGGLGRIRKTSSR